MSRIYTQSATGANSALMQGEIISGLIQYYIDVASVGTDDLRVFPKMHPLAIILSQGCELAQDRAARNGTINADKMIPNVLFCEVVTAEVLRGNVGAQFWKSIKINDNKRYQFLQKVDPVDDALYDGVPELGIDFKRYFTIPTDEVYRRIELGEAKRRCSLVSPYLEHLCGRFASFLSRVALEIDHISD